MIAASLPIRVTALKASLAALDAMTSNVQETALLTALRTELQKDVEALDQALAFCQLLQRSGVAIALPASLGTARARAALLLERFSADPKAATLKKGTNWANLRQEMRQAARDAQAQAGLAWQAYKGTVFTGDKPQIIASRIAQTPANQDALARYQAKFEQFSAAFQSLPRDPADVARVRALADNLKAIAKEFDFNVPEDVKRFLAAVLAGGAGLDLLTAPVATWLKTHGAFPNYRIVSAD